MQFLTPWIWITALSVSIPLIIHLTRKESKDPTLFSSLMFFRRIPLQEFRRRRLRKLLLLALRCLAILLLVAAFSQPVLTDWIGQGIGRPAVSTVILVDTSLSMSRPEVWENTKSAVLEKINRMGRQDETMLAVFGLSNGSLTTWEKDKRVLTNAVNQRLKTTSGATSYASGLEFAAAQFEGREHPAKRIVLVTDLQKSGIEASALNEVIFPPGVSLEIQDTGTESRNFYISGVQVEREIFGEKYPTPLIVHVSGPEDEPLNSELRLYLENDLVQRKEFTLSGQGNASVQLESFEVEEGITKGKVVLGINDDFAVDDVYHFVIERRSPFVISLLSGNGEESNYFREAMSSGENLAFKVESISSTGQLDNMSARVIVLDDAQRLPSPGTLESHLEQGGGLILAHGRNTQPNRIQSLQSFLPGELSERLFARSLDRSYLFWDQISWDHPIFSPFDGSDHHLLDSIQFFAHWKLLPREDTRILSRFNTGEPALLEKEFGKGRVLQLAVPLGRSWSDFPLRSAYVPFWHQIVRHSAGWDPKPDSHLVAELVAVATETSDSDDSTRDWEILDPSGRRILSLGEESPDTIRLESEGFYEVRRDRGTDYFAVNTDPRESDLSSVSAEQFLSHLPIQPQGRLPGNLGELKTEELNQPVWWLFLILAALLFLSEAFYSNWQRNKRDQLA